MQKSQLPNEPIKPAYPLGDANAEVPTKPERREAEPKPAPPPTPQVVNEPQTDGE